MATRTTPNGGKAVNVATIVAMKAVSDSPARRLRISRGLPLRGSISVKVMPDSTLLMTHASTIRIRNSTAGSGRRLPTRSTTSRLRASHPRAGGVAEAGFWSSMTGSLGRDRGAS